MDLRERERQCVGLGSCEKGGGGIGRGGGGGLKALKRGTGLTVKTDLLHLQRLWSKPEDLPSYSYAAKRRRAANSAEDE